MLSRVLFLSSIGIVGALAIPAQVAAMEMPSQNICGTCGQEKPNSNSLTFSLLSFRANRCRDCKAILRENKDIETGKENPEEFPTIIYQTVHYPDQQESTEPDLEAGNQSAPQPKPHSAINVAKELCIVCAQPVDDGTKPHIYKCNHAVHEKCFANNKTLQSCLLCNQRKTEAPADNKGGFLSWVFSSKPTAAKTEAPQENVTMFKESYEQLAQRFNELQCHAQLAAQREQELLNQINATEKKFATKQEMQEAANGLLAYKSSTRQALNNHELSMRNLANQQISDRNTINGLINQLQAQNESAWIERGSLALGGLAALIAHNRKHSANVSALVGVGTAATIPLHN